MMNILCIVIRQAKKLLQLLDSGRLRPSTYGLNLVRVSMYTTSFHYMPQVLYGSLTKETLLPLSIQCLTSQPIKYSMQVQQVLLFTRAEHQDIVKVYGHATQQVRERQVHQTLEGCWCIHQTNRNNHILIQALRCQKCSFMLVTFADANLMVGMAKVYQAKHCRFSKVVKQVGDTQNREHIELCLAI